jgi:hypothetical protein
MQLLHARFHVLEVFEDRFEKLRAFHDVLRHLGEEVKKLRVFWHQTDHAIS